MADHDNSIEIWKPCPGFEESYEVSSHGRVRSSRKWSNTQVGYILKPKTMKGRGYLLVTLMKGGRKYSRRVHILVAKAFIPQPLDTDQVNHENGVKADNRVSNLTWTTQEGNNLHAAETGLNPRGQYSKRATITNAQAIAIKADIDAGMMPLTLIAEKHKASYAVVVAIKHRQAWKWLDARAAVLA
jgi:NUMOD4 motif/HNH endonuclease